MMPAVEPGQRATYIDSDEKLSQCCQALSSSGVLGFDSEFVRTDTYFPKPGLFQLDNGAQTFLVDPLGISGWQEFSALLNAPDTTLIIHSSSEDLGLLRTSLNVLPTRLFDTQRAAAFAGDGYSLSYQALVKAELGIDIPKDETRSDWLRRPLSETQLNYAALDVEYLIALQQRLVERLTARNMLDWFEQDCRELLANVPDENDTRSWESAYKTIGSAWQLDTESLRLLQKLAYWREREARVRNKPRNWIVRDPELLALAQQLPEPGRIDEAAIRRTGVFSSRFADREAARLARYLNAPDSFSEPAGPDSLSAPLGGSARALLKRLQGLTRDLATQLDISPELLARKKLWVELLENLQQGKHELWPPGLSNWRREVLEERVLAILPAQLAN